MGHSSCTNNGRAGGCEVCVQRPALTALQRSQHYQYTSQEPPGLLESLGKKAKESCLCSWSCLTSSMTSRLPILSWLPSYSPKKSLVGDIVAGITVAIMHIPQGMAYALLAGLPPIVGMYMAFFPLLVYAVFGTSRHCSMGTFAVVCLMTGKIVGDLATTDDSPGPPLDPTLNDSVATNSTAIQYSPVQVAAVVALVNGVVQLVLGVLQLGSLSVFLSDMLVSGFTTGAAVHVFTSQFKYLFGIKVQRYSGPFRIIYITERLQCQWYILIETTTQTYRDIVYKVMQSNSAAMIISGITILILLLNNEILKPWVRKKTVIPIPIELIVVIGGTVISYFCNLNDNYDIRIVGTIPTGLPEPSMPAVELVSVVMMDAVIISIVAYTISFSMAKIFAKRHGYEVDATQELYALGLSNVFGSLFGCGPIAASLSRSLIQEAVGGATQITSFICCSIVVLILLFVGPLFETLPNCVLSSIIVVALKGMFLQVNDLLKIWAVNRTDALIWLASFLGVVLIDIDYGLLLGLLVSVMVLLSRSQQPPTACLGPVPNTDLYLDIHKYSAVKEIPTVSIFQFGGPLHFANSEYFHTQLVTVTGLDPSVIGKTKKLLLKQKELETKETVPNSKEAKGCHTNSSELSENKTAKLMKKLRPRTRGSPAHTTLSVPEVEYLVLDLSRVSYVDSSGGKLLTQLHKDYEAVNITVCLAAATEPVLETLRHCGVEEEVPVEQMFHSVHDAVVILTQPNLTPLSEQSTNL